MENGEIFSLIFYIIDMEGSMRKIMRAMFVVFTVAMLCQALCADIPQERKKVSLIGIEFTVPKGGESFPLHMGGIIGWKYLMFADSSPIKLVLFKGGMDPVHKVGNIVQNIPLGTGGRGSYPWVIGKTESGDAGIGDQYRIRIISMSGAFSCFSNPFSIMSSMVTDEETGHNVFPQKGDCIISEFSVKPVGGANPHLLLVIKCQNKSSRLLRDLRLTLVKNHFSVKGWSPIGLGTGATLGFNYEDPMPSPGQTNKYIAILSWGDPIAQPQSVLDRKETEYRRGTTIIGHL